MVFTTSTFRRLVVTVMVSNIFIIVSLIFIQLISNMAACDYPGKGSPRLLGIARLNGIVPHT